MGKSKELAELGGVVTQSNGNVGIGTSAAGQKLEVNSGNSDVGLRISRYSSGAYYSDIVHTTGPEGLAFKIGDGSTVTERMRIDASGRVTMPYQPAFYVYHNGSQSVSNFAQPIIQFDSKISDVGNHFNTSTYTYTAPVSGWYHFDATVSYSGSFTAGRIIAYIKINGSNTASRQMYRSGQDTGVNVSASRYLSANDTVQIQTYQDSGSTRNILGSEQWTHFSGYLIG